MTKQIVLVYGARKSGTTLIQRLVDGGGFFCHPAETKLKSAPSLLNKIKSGETISDQEVMWFFQGVEYSSDQEKLTEQIGDVRQSLPKLKSAKDYVALDVTLALQNTKQNKDSTGSVPGVIIKDVGGDPNKVIPMFFEAFDAGKVIAVIRDPRYTASAIFRKRRNGGGSLSWGKVIRESLEAFRITSALLSMPETERFRRFHHEDTVLNPEKFVSDAKTYLGLPELPHAQPTFDGQPNAVRTASDPSRANSVFVRTESWEAGLTAREVFCVRLASLFYWPTMLRLRQPWAEPT